MLLGTVIGHLWATNRSAGLGDKRLLIIKPLYAYNLDPDLDYLVAVDNLGAGAHDLVIVTFGEPARLVSGNADLPLEAAVIGIVDNIDYHLDAALSDPPMLPKDLKTRLGKSCLPRTQSGGR